MRLKPRFLNFRTYIQHSTTTKMIKEPKTRLICKSLKQKCHGVLGLDQNHIKLLKCLVSD